MRHAWDIHLQVFAGRESSLAVYETKDRVELETAGQLVQISAGKRRDLLDQLLFMGQHEPLPKALLRRLMR